MHRVACLMYFCSSLFASAFHPSQAVWLVVSSCDTLHIKIAGTLSLFFFADPIPSRETGLTLHSSVLLLCSHLIDPANPPSPWPLHTKVFVCLQSLQKPQFHEDMCGSLFVLHRVSPTWKTWAHDGIVPPNPNDHVRRDVGMWAYDQVYPRVEAKQNN